MRVRSSHPATPRRDGDGAEQHRQGHGEHPPHDQAGDRRRLDLDPAGLDQRGEDEGVDDADPPEGEHCEREGEQVGDRDPYEAHFVRRDTDEAQAQRERGEVDDHHADLREHRQGEPAVEPLGDVGTEALTRVGPAIGVDRLPEPADDESGAGSDGAREPVAPYDHEHGHEDGGRDRDAEQLEPPERRGLADSQQQDESEEWG